MKSICIFAQNKFMNKAEIGKAIEKYRAEKGISKYSIVKSTGLTFPQLSAIEAGANNYTIDSLVTYLTALKLKIDIK